MPKKNIFVFVVFSVLVLGGWGWLYYSWRSNDATPNKTERPLTTKERADVFAQAPLTVPSLEGGLPEFVRLALALVDAKSLSTTPRPLTSEQREQYLLTMRFGLPLPAPTETAQDFQLGDAKYPDYYVLATVTTRGGGIRNLTLPKFQKADENGKPVFTSDGNKVPLELIEDDPIMASFLMAHYPVPAKEECIAYLCQSLWKVESHTTSDKESRLVLSFDRLPDYPGLKIVKTYHLEPKTYHIGLTIEIRDERDPNGTDKEPREFRYQIAGSHGTPIEGEFYSSTYRTPMIGIVNDRGILERDLDETQQRISVKEGGDRVPLGQLGDNWIQYAGTDTQYFSSLIVVDNDQAPAFRGGVKPANVLAYCRPTLETEEMRGIFFRFDAKNKRLDIISRDTKQKIEFYLLPRAIERIEKRQLKDKDEVLVSHYRSFDGRYICTDIHIGTVRRRQLDDFTVRTVSNILKLEPGRTIVHKYLLYHGPAKVRLLAQFTGDKAVSPELVERYTDTLHLSTLRDYHSAGWFGWIAQKTYWTDILILTTRFMHWLLNVLHMVVPNYGLTIVILTLIVRGAMFPISRRTAQLSAKMQAIAPEMRKLQEKYKDDPQAKTAAMMELYRKHGVNPLGSCAPMVLQMPFFLGLYYCLQESIHFRLAEFLWIQNLAAPDMLFRWGDGIPLISDPDNMSGGFLSFLYLGPYFNILPVLAVTLMLVQQKLMTPPPADEQQEMQQKMMKYMFIFIGIMFYKVAAGLAIYFIASSLWGLAERKLLPKKNVPAVADAPAGGGGGGGGGSGPAGGGPNRGKGKAARKELKEKKPETPMQRVKDWWAEVLRSAQKK